MKKYISQKEFEAEIQDNVYRSKESIDVGAFSLNVDARIEVSGDIKAWDISYYAVAFAYYSIKAKSINLDYALIRQKASAFRFCFCLHSIKTPITKRRFLYF